jgi:hypothetical protein
MRSQLLKYCELGEMLLEHRYWKEKLQKEGVKGSLESDPLLNSISGRSWNTNNNKPSGIRIEGFQAPTKVSSCLKEFGESMKFKSFPILCIQILVMHKMQNVYREKT